MAFRFRATPGSIARVRVSLLYVEGCPSWQVAAARLDEALRLSGHAAQQVERILVTSVEQADALKFVGSPTFLIEGEDPFLDDERRPVGLACRVYRSQEGLGGCPSIDELIEAIAAQA